MRSIGLDVHRNFAQIAVVENGMCRDEGRIGVFRASQLVLRRPRNT